MGMRRHKKTNEKNKNKNQTQTYPHAIFFDFESFHDSTKRKEATYSLAYENVLVPILVSIGDTLELAPPIFATLTLKN